MSGSEKFALTTFLMAVGVVLMGALYFVAGDKTYLMEQGVWLVAAVLFVLSFIGALGDHP